MSRYYQFRWLMIIFCLIIGISICRFGWYFLFVNPQTQTNEHPQHFPGREVPLGELVAVSKTKTLLLSAYQEHRSGRKEVRVIAVVLRSEDVTYQCHICCQKQIHISKAVSYTQESHFRFPYGTSHIMCPVPSGCETPLRITLTSAGAESNVNSGNFLEVKNQEAKSDSFPYNFTVCLSTMFDFTNVLQLVQNLEMFQLLGVNRVAVYKTSNSPETQRVLDFYTQKGLLEVVPWSLSRFLNVSHSWLPEHGPGDIHYYGQIPALHDCVYRYMYQSQYLALQDIDELILPQSVSSWLELLPLLEKKYRSDCFMFENNIFPNNIHRYSPDFQVSPSESAWQNISGVNILAHLYQEPVFKKTLYENFKLIANPRYIISPTVHGLEKADTACSWVDRTIARMYHTRPLRASLTQDQLIYDGRLLYYRDRLTPAVNQVLKQTGLLPEQQTNV